MLEKIQDNTVKPLEGDAEEDAEYDFDLITAKAEKIHNARKILKEEKELLNKQIQKIELLKR
jgi:hypothetical protein